MGLFDAIASTVNTGLNLWGARRARTAQQAHSEWQSQWNRQGDQEARVFGAQEAEKARDWNAGQAAIDRDWQAGQTDLQRSWSERMFGQERAFNAEQAATNRSFQERMSNTQYQRATSDMIAAGINPMLAVSQGGAGNVSGASASASAPSSSAPGGRAASGPAAGGGGNTAAPSQQFQNLIGPALASGFQAYLSLKQAANLDAMTETQRATTLNVMADTESKNASKDLTSANTRILDEMFKGYTEVGDGGEVTVHGPGKHYRNIVKEQMERTRQSGYESVMKQNQSSASRELPAKAKAERETAQYGVSGAKSESEFNEMMMDLIKGGSHSAAGMGAVLKAILPMIYMGVKGAK